MTPTEFRTARLALDLTQGQLAEYLGVYDSATIRRWEMAETLVSHRPIPGPVANLLAMFLEHGLPSSKATERIRR